MLTLVSTLTCTFCGSDSPLTARLCANCGRDLSAVECAGFWLRAEASLVDFIILVIALLVLALALAVWSLILWCVVVVAYNVGFWAVKGATPGKMVLDIKVLRADGDSEGIGFGRALLRQVGYVASTVTFGIGFLMTAFDREKRGLHDHIAGTKVVVKA